MWTETEGCGAGALDRKLGVGAAWTVFEVTLVTGAVAVFFETGIETIALLAGRCWRRLGTSRSLCAMTSFYQLGSDW